MNKKILKTDHQFDEKLMIEKAAAGDREAFNMIINKYARMTYNLCYKFLGNTEDAEDCAQEVFLKVYRSINKFAFRSAFSTWLYQIAVNTCKNFKSTKQFRKNNSEMSMNAEYADSDKSHEIGDKKFLPEESTVRSEQYEMILSAIRKLPSDLCKVVILRDVENRSYEEISEITEYKIGTVKSKLSRARHHLREDLRGML